MTKKKIIYITSIITVVLIISSYVLKKTIDSLPSISALQDYTPHLTTKLYDIKGKIIGELFFEKRTLTPLRKIPQNMINAILATEDDSFYNHWGISIMGIVRAFSANIAAGRVVQGGSTITQQLAKSIFLTRDRTLTRKIKEFLLALQLEYNYSKQEILQFYLNQIYLGHGAYGIAAASKVYFDKNVEDLNLQECALLAGLPKAPSYFSPYKHPTTAMHRRNFVLKAMETKKLITPSQAREAILSPTDVIHLIEIKKRSEYFVEHIRRLLGPKYGNLLYTSGLKIYTTLDLDMQKAAEEIIEQKLIDFDERKRRDIMSKLKLGLPGNTTFYDTLLRYFPEDTTSYAIITEIQKYNRYSAHTRSLITKLATHIEEITPVQGALVCIDVKTGQIRAMVGGRSFTESQFNRVIQASRQPGSCFKPCIYTAAIDNGWTATNILEDFPVTYYKDNSIKWTLISKTTEYTDIPEDIMEEIDFEDPEKIWNPKNYGNKYRGEVTIRTALEKSINMCAIDLISKIGPSKAVEYAKKFGIKSRIQPFLSAALGSFVVTPLEMTGLFLTLANGGIRPEPYTIIKICNNNNQILETTSPKIHEAISPTTAYIMTNLLTGVVNNGTGKYAKSLGRPAAGKTGTTNKFTDAWFIGFTPQLVTGVWVGYDNCATLGNKMSGGVLSCPIWTDFMKRALKHYPVLDFSVPQNIVFKRIDKDSGLLALEDTKNIVIEAFIKGTEPTKYAYQRQDYEDEDENEDSRDLDTTIEDYDDTNDNDEEINELPEEPN